MPVKADPTTYVSDDHFEATSTSEPVSINEGGMTVVDDELDPVVTDVTGDPMDDELDDLLRRDTDLGI